MKSKKFTKTPTRTGQIRTAAEAAGSNTPTRCPLCHEFAGRGYPRCAACQEVAEQPIRAAWRTLLQTRQVMPDSPAEAVLAATVLENSPEYWWSEVEAAMRLTPCTVCGGPLGYGEPTCEQCWWSSDMLWGRDVEYAQDGELVRNEHALRVVLRGLAQEKRHSSASLEGWRLYLPFLLQLDSRQGPGLEYKDTAYAQTISAWIKAGRGHELLACQSIAEMYALTRRGRA